MLTVRIAKREIEAEDIVRLELVEPRGASLPAFSAGSHIDVVVREGLVRQYSLCNCPSETDRYVIAVLRDPNSRGGSVGVHDLLSPGNHIQISEPRNHFPLIREADASVLVAGGIGITPLLCMARELQRAGAAFELHYCTRNAERTAFLEDMEYGALKDEAFVYHDDKSSARRFDAASAIGAPNAGKHLYVCGPSGFIDHVLSTAKLLGWSDANLHREYFGAPASSDAGADEAFDIEVASTGQTICVPAGKSIIHVLSEHGIDIPASCEQGVCGTCVTRILSGTPDHRDMYLTEEEHARNDQFTPCCSRAKSQKLVLDL